jgi:hypothetical protein
VRIDISLYIIKKHVYIIVHTPAPVPALINFCGRRNIANVHVDVAGTKDHPSYLFSFWHEFELSY